MIEKLRIKSGSVIGNLFSGSLFAQAAPHPHPIVQEALARRTAHFAAKRESLFELDLYLVVLYEGADCRQPQGTETTYVATLLSGSIVPGYPAWRSFSFVGV